MFQWVPNVSESSLGTNLAAGTYAIQITSSDNCVISDEMVLGQPDPIQIDVVEEIEPDCGEDNGSIEVLATGGSGTLNYAWDNAQTGAILDGLVEGNYALTVTDFNGCEAEALLVLDCNGNPEIIPYEFMSPNGDGLNEFWIIDNINYYPAAQIYLYNRWGGLVKTLFAPYQNDWDGTGEDGNTLSPDTYFFVIEPNDGFSDSITGFLEIQYTE